MSIISDYAPDPKKQLVYTNLQNKTLSDVTALDIERLTDPTFIQATNQDALITYNIVNKAAMRDGGPMPDKGTVLVLTQSNDSDVQYVQPAKGEVFEIMGISATVTGVDGNNTYSMYLCSETGQSTALMVYIQNLISGSTNVSIFPSDTESKFPLTLTNTMFLRLDSNMDNQTGTTAFKIAYIQRR